jgi:hypothetical protein
MYRAFLSLVAFCWAATGLAENRVSIKYPSPDARFAMRITEPREGGDTDPKIELIEKTSGKVMVDLGTAYLSHLSDTVLLWSADSKWAAYATRGEREGETSVYFWNGSAFYEIPLPDNMPAPDITFRKGASGAVKNYGGAVKPLRWLKSGGLELSSESTMMSREDGATYTGVLVFTLGFDSQHHALRGEGRENQNHRFKIGNLKNGDAVPPLLKPSTEAFPFKLSKACEYAR